MSIDFIFVFLFVDKVRLVGLTVSVDDLLEREAFKADQGEYLPSDIWPGLMEPPPRYDITSADSDLAKIPDLPDEVVEKAIQRLKAAVPG